MLGGKRSVLWAGILPDATDEPIILTLEELNCLLDGFDL